MKTRGKGWTDASGYRIIRAAGHPMARADGSAREHRVLLYDAIGSGGHSCHWCGHLVSWELTHRAGGSDQERWDALVVDHLDGERQSNDPAVFDSKGGLISGNTVPSCPWCNSNRPFWRQFGVSGEEFRGVPPVKRPRFGELAKQAAKGARRPESSSSSEPAKSSPSRRVAQRVPWWFRPVARWLAWRAAPSWASLVALAAALAFGVGFGVGWLLEVPALARAAVGFAVAALVGLWAPGPPPRSAAGSTLVADGPPVATGWDQVGARLDEFAAARKALGRVVPAVPEWDDDEDDAFDDGGDEVVVPLVFPDPSKRGGR